MIKLIAKLFLLTLMVLGICYATFYLNPDFQNNYLASIKLKLDKLEKIERNKIVIIGGSNVCFGINSETIEDSLEIPVVNMGLHASLGPKFWLEYVKSDLNAGDILIMSPEYAVLTKEKWYGMTGTAVPKTILYTPSKIGILFSDYEFFKKTTIGIFRTIKAYWENYPFEKDAFIIKQVYDVRSFDGDNFRSVYLNGTHKKKYKKDKLEFDAERDAWEDLKAYKDYFDKKGVKFYLSPPSLLKESIDVKSAKEYLKTFSEKSTVPILNNNLNYFYNRDLFFDTNYHLNQKGNAFRTNQLSNDINKALLDKNIKVKEHKKYLSKNTFQNILLDNIKMKHNVKLQRFKNDSIRVVPTRDGKMGFLMYKTEPINYIGSLLKLKIKAKPAVLEKLRFRGIPFYEFDYIKSVNQDTYVLCKSLSNVITNPKNNEFSSIGIGFDFEMLTTKDEFTILSMQVVNQDLNCEDVSEYDYNDAFYIPKRIKEVYFKTQLFDSESIFLHDIINIPESDIRINSKTKYIASLDNNTLKVFDFYKKQPIFELNNVNQLMFINSSKFKQEIELKY